MKAKVLVGLAVAALAAVGCPGEGCLPIPGHSDDGGDRGATDRIADRGAIVDRGPVADGAPGDLRVEDHPPDRVALDRGADDLVDADSFDRSPPRDGAAEGVGNERVGDVAAGDAHVDRTTSIEGGFDFDALALDGTIGSYEGVAEDGVVCGEAGLCPAQQMCCLAMGPSFSCGNPCEGAVVELTCDGPEDCGEGEECCVTPYLNTYCAGSGLCYQDNPNNVLICGTDGDCRGGFVCCSYTDLIASGLEVGWCQRACE